MVIVVVKVVEVELVVVVDSLCHYIPSSNLFKLIIQSTVATTTQQVLQ